MPRRARMFRFERRLRRRDFRIARLGRQGPSPATSCGSPCIRGEASEGGRSPPPSYLAPGELWRTLVLEGLHAFLVVGRLAHQPHVGGDEIEVRAQIEPHRLIDQPLY